MSTQIDQLNTLVTEITAAVDTAVGLLTSETSASVELANTNSAIDAAIPQLQSAYDQLEAAIASIEASQGGGSNTAANTASATVAGAPVAGAPAA